MSEIVVVDYGVGNVTSIANMIKKAGGSPRITGAPAEVRAASKVILPGVGAFDECASRLTASGLEESLLEAVDSGVYLIGICVGFQLLGRGSEEGIRSGLGLLAAETVRLRPEADAQRHRRVPHMGWSELAVQQDSWLLSAEARQRFYFLHSFHVKCDRHEDVLATTSYGESVVAAASRGRVAGVQFHPEKSHRFGLDLFRRVVGL